jgi:hypothetical protein
VATLKRIRLWLTVVVVGLVAAGITAFPLVHETRWLDGVLDDRSLPFVARTPWLVHWIDHVTVGIGETGRRYPFMAYGTDWLAYAHLILAILFLGTLRDPARNVWVVQFGLIACAAIVPLALIAGPVRGIPFWWTCIDLSFGVFGAIPLLIAYRYIRRLARTEPVARLA